MDWSSFLFGFILGAGSVLILPWIAVAIVEAAEKIAEKMKRRS